MKINNNNNNNNNNKTNYYYCLYESWHIGIFQRRVKKNECCANI